MAICLALLRAEYESVLESVSLENSPGCGVRIDFAGICATHPLWRASMFIPSASITKGEDTWRICSIKAMSVSRKLPNPGPMATAW